MDKEEARIYKIALRVIDVIALMTDEYSMEDKEKIYKKVKEKLC